MREVTVAVVQTSPVVGKVEENLERMDHRIEEICTSHHVDLIVFPELATTGYECGIQFNDLAERVPGHTSSSVWLRRERWRAWYTMQPY